MKKVYFIGGTMGIGKTSVCQILKRKLDKSVFLDGDWCWDAHPFVVNPETKEMVMDNICHLLNNFIHCPAYEHIIFCWVMHEQAIIDRLLASLDTRDCEVKCISLVCSGDALSERLLRDIRRGIRQADVLERSLHRLPLYEHLKTIKLDVSGIDPETAAERILRMQDRAWRERQAQSND